MSEACRQAGRQTDRQAKGEKRKRKKKKEKRRKYQSAPLNTESFLLALLYLLYSLSLSPYYLTLMPLSFGIDDTSFAPFFD